MLQKIENAYLGILRFAVIVISGLLLVLAVIMGLSSLQALRSEPSLEKVTPKVSNQDLVKEITRKGSDQDGNEQAGETPLDPNKKYHERSAKAISDFVAKYSNGEESVDLEQIVEITRSKAAEFEDPAHAAAYAKGMAEAMEKTLADPAVVKEAQSMSPSQVVDRTIEAFTEKFNAQIEAVNKSNEQKQEEYLEKKADGTKSLYAAAAAFASFISIVFLLIIIRIERNLRHLTHLTPVKS